MTNKETMKNGSILYSSVTCIYYKEVKGRLMKYCTYPNAIKGWQPSQYRGSFNSMKVATDKQVSILRKCTA